MRSMAPSGLLAKETFLQKPDAKRFTMLLGFSWARQFYAVYLRCFTTIVVSLLAIFWRMISA